MGRSYPEPGYSSPRLRAFDRIVRVKPDPDSTKTTARRSRPSVAFPVGFVMIAALLVGATATVVSRTTAERIGEIGRSANAADEPTTPSGASRLLAERRATPSKRSHVAGTEERSARSDVPPPTTTTSAPEPPPTTTTSPPPSPTTTPPAPSVPPATEDPGTADPAARAHAAFASAMPEVWRHAIPAELRIIPGQSSWASTRGRMYIGSHHASGDWARLRAIVAHEFGHLIAFRYGTSSALGAPPAGWPEPGLSAPERWADCVATAFTGRPLGSHGQAACSDESLSWTVAHLAAGPPR